MFVLGYFCPALLEQTFLLFCGIFEGVGWNGVDLGGFRPFWVMFGHFQRDIGPWCRLVILPRRDGSIRGPVFLRNPWLSTEIQKNVFFAA